MKKIVVFFLLFAPIALWPQEIPNYIGHVNDYAGIIPANEKSELEATLRGYSSKTTIEIAIVTVASLSGYSIEDYTIKLANKWGVGKHGLDNGIVILIAPNERKWRIEIGRGMEAYLTDGQAKRIGERNFKPHFRRGDYGGGLKAAIAEITGELGTLTPAEREKKREMEEEQRRAYRAQEAKEAHERWEAFLGILPFIIGSVVVLGFTILMITLGVKAVKKRREEEEEAKKEVAYAEASLRQSLNHARELERRGFRGAVQAVSALNNLDAVLGFLKEQLTKIKTDYPQISARAVNLSSAITDATEKIFAAEKKRAETLGNLKDAKTKIALAENAIPEAKSDLQKMVVRYPESIWEKLADFEDEATERIDKSVDLITKAESLVSMEAQSFSDAKSAAEKAVGLATDALAAVKEVSSKYSETRKAEQEAPAKLKSIPRLIEKAASKINRPDVGSSAKRYLDSGGKKFEEAKRYQEKNDFSLDWLVFLTMLLAAEELIKKAISQSDEDVEEEARRRRRRREEEESRRSSYTSSIGGGSGGGSFGGFGGGGFSGGGSSGSW